MFSVIFEVHPKKEEFDRYLGLAKQLKPILEGMDGFIDNERFGSTGRPGWILSHSTWRDEKSVVRWRTVAKHHETQEEGRNHVFQDYHLRVGEIVRDSAPPSGMSVVEQRLDETDIGAGKYMTLTEVRPVDQTKILTADDLRQTLPAVRGQNSLVEFDIFSSIYNKGKLALLVAWSDRRAAEAFKPELDSSLGTVRQRVVRIVRDYGMYDRRESPQYYPTIGAEGHPSQGQ
jgi:heme-degrading monooxygenase HmoA